ncbi:DNA cytosine methyltransferase [Bacillus stercoris]|nr:DNA cytosine methyltransferase [Bacillus stercoris]
MENVPELIKQTVFKDFVRDLEDQGYHVSHSIVNCADYGIPQERKRLVLLASKFGDIEILSPSLLGEGSKTVREAIGDLPPLGQVRCMKKTLFIRVHRFPLKPSKNQGVTPIWHVAGLG